MSVFDMFKIGIGPSSSHTMGPWRAAQQFLAELDAAGVLPDVNALSVDLYGSLAKTGKGHATDMGLLLGLSGEDPAAFDSRRRASLIAHIEETETLSLAGQFQVSFCPARDIRFLRDQQLPFHPNALRFFVTLADGSTRETVYYSVGGGFVVKAGEEKTVQTVEVPYLTNSAAELLAHCQSEQCLISEIGRRNALKSKSAAEIQAGLDNIWEVMLESIFTGCHTDGILPGGLQVERRAAAISQSLLGPVDHLATTDNLPAWIEAVSNQPDSFAEVLKWVCCFALAVNEENAAFGRVVTAPTNGAAGVIPAVLLYYLSFCGGEQSEVASFLLTAAEIGWVFKKRATISAALGGCQAEIGVSSAMAAAALAERLGGTPAQSAEAAEIAMEHHLGLTCDPVGGFVQIPCIERNCMGAIKAITAATLALQRDPAHSRVTLDVIVDTMWETARDMSSKYKETSEGGLATKIPVNLSEC
ncbi:MAG: L-serine ammonia-lyase [Bythopirellula sp.]